MADENNEDDSWLYGSTNNENAENREANSSQIDGKTVTETTETTDDSVALAQNNNESIEGQVDGSNETRNITADGTLNGGGGSDINGDNYNENGDDDEEKKSKSDSDNDDSDDDIVVTIRDIQPASSFNIKQRGTLAASGSTTQEKPKANLGKFSIEEFESVGTIAGQTAIEYNIEAIEDKPWRKPGADITDYFNYGFSEETWRAYCERQKKMRHESGAGLSGLNPQQSSIGNNANRILTSLTSMDSKYSSSGSTNSHSHGGPQNFSNRSGFGAPPEQPSKENVIQVMTAERREYSRPKGKFDVPMAMPPPPFNMPNEPFYPEDNFSYGYEPTQEQQWNNDANVGWMPSGIKELTPGPQTMMGPPPMNMNMPPPNAMMPPNMINIPPQMVPPPINMNMNMQMPNPMMPPPVIPPSMPPNRERINEDHRNNQNEYREHEDKRAVSITSSSSSSSAWRPRDKERDYRERERDEESRRDRDRYRSERERDRGSSRRERSRSRERSERRRRSKSREPSRKSRDKKKSHKKDKDDSD